MKYLLLGCITLLGISLRFVNVLPFKIYPDSYLQMILAENIQNGGKIIGTLGKEGMMYPDFLAWTRPMFPLLLFGLHTFSTNSSQTAVAIAFLSSILAIPLSFLVLKKLFHSDPIGIFGALLVAVSFNHTVWSGFILTEPLGVLFMLLFLYTIFSFTKEKQSLLVDITAGVLFACCVLTRFEYSLLFFPVIVYLRLTAVSWGRIMSLFSISILILLVAFSILFPFDAIFSMVIQFLPHITLLAIFLGVLFLLVILWPRIKQSRIPYLSRKTGITLWLLLCFLLLIHSLFFSFPYVVLTGISDFIKSDFLISLFFMGGVGFMIFKKVYTKELIFVFMACVLLYAAYYRANPYSVRYLVHLLPFLLIPASYFLATTMQFIVKSSFWRSPESLGKVHKYVRDPGPGQDDRRSGSIFTIIILFFVLVAICIYQFFLSYLGMKNWQHGLYTRLSYEETAGNHLAKILPKDVILLVSFPESYYVTTHRSIYSLADTPPFIYIPSTLSDRELVIVEDMGMRDIFPTFTKFLDTSLQDQKEQTFFTHASYQYADRVLVEKYPVILYHITIRELKEKIHQQFPSSETF